MSESWDWEKQVVPLVATMAKQVFDMQSMASLYGAVDPVLLALVRCIDDEIREAEVASLAVIDAVNRGAKWDAVPVVIAADASEDDRAKLVEPELQRLARVFFDRWARVKRVHSVLEREAAYSAALVTGT